MGFNSVYRSLVEIFPQIDARILRAVAIEHPKDADEAVGVVLSEIVPCLPSNVACNFSPHNKTFRSTSNDEAKHEMEDGESRHNGAHVVSVSNSAAPLRTIPLIVDYGGNACAADTESVPHLNKVEVVSLSGGNNAFHGYAGDEEFVPLITASEYATNAQAKPGSSASSENAVHNLVDLNPVVDATNFQQGSGSSNIARETSNGLVSSENGDVEFGGAFSASFDRSSEGCSIDHLETIIEDAKSNKKTLFAVMESVMNLMREVEVQEKDAENAKEESARGGVDTLRKVEELKKVLEHAREANDMHTGEVYGEKSILATEVKELENRLLNLSEERDTSLAMLNEMRGMLEARLAAALEMKNAAEQEGHEKEDIARKALAEQEAFMEKVVQESKLLQQEAEENSKLREFLMDRGQIVDSLQGEISVICQDVRLLKEKFDERVPLSQSISSSQTSCRLASSASAASSLVNVVAKSAEPFYEKPVVPDDNESPSASLNKEIDDVKELLEDGWDIC